MAIVVACQCGKTFQTKDEYLGKTGRCPACGQPIQIQPAVLAPAQGVAGLPEEAETINPRAAAIQLARERQAEADRRFMLRMGLVAAGVIVVVALVMGVRMGLASNSTASAAPVEGDKKESVVAKNTTVAPAAPETPSTPEPAVPAPATEPKKPEIDLSKFEVKDDIDRYVLLALKTRDRHTRMNAKIFRPDEPLLDFEPDERTLTPEHYKLVEDRLNKLASKMDLDLGPQPAPETDLQEARMLLDTELVGSGSWLGTQGGRNNYLVFVDAPTLRMAQFTEKYGKPQKTLKSGDATLHFIGRIVLMEAADGGIIGVARRITRIAKLAEPEPAPAK